MKGVDCGLVSVAFVCSSITSVVAATILDAGVTCMLSCQIGLLSSIAGIAYALYEE